MKKLLVTHEPDCDGVGAAILFMLVEPDVDVEYKNYNDLNEFFTNFIKEKGYENYDNIFITDLMVSLDVAEEINKVMKDKILAFDHHVTNLELNKYDWVNVEVKTEKGLACGTSLFYDYLLKNYDNEVLRNEKVEEFVELTRQGDTWEWYTKYNNYDAKRLGNIFKIYGNDKYISVFLKKLKNNEELFSEMELFILELEDKRIDDYITKKEEKMVIKDIDGYKVGIVYAEIYKSYLGNALAEKYKDGVDFIAMIDFDKAISYRGIKETINLGDFAKIYGGGGHPRASASPIPESIHEVIFNLIFNNK